MHNIYLIVLCIDLVVILLSVYFFNFSFEKKVEKLKVSDEMSGNLERINALDLDYFELFFFFVKKGTKLKVK